MKTFARKKKSSLPGGRRQQHYALHPKGLLQQVQQEKIRRILRSANAQAKLTIGQPNDKYEQEADHVADQVMAMPDPTLQRQPENEEEEETLQTKPLADQITPLVQRQEEPPEEEEEPVQAKFLQKQDKEEVVQKQPAEEEEEEIQTKSNSAERLAAPPRLETRVNSLKGGGEPLDQATRSFFEPRLGYDFSHVRVHADSGASEATKMVNAKAFTLGNDIAFGDGKLSPGTDKGDWLLAHELAHVIQGKKGILSRNGGETSADPGVQYIFDPQNDMEEILGPIPEQQSILFPEAKLLKLYRYLKNLRKYAPSMKQLVLNLLDVYFPDAGQSIWENSKQPFAGYIGSRYQSRPRMEAAKELGLTEHQSRRAVKKFLGSDVIFFSGHHYGSGLFDTINLPDLKTRGRKKRPAIFEKAKLVMISSCSCLTKSELPMFRRRFPNAYILGWRGGAPYSQDKMMAKFLTKIPDDLILENRDDIETVVNLWIDFIENLEQEGIELKSEKGKKRKPHGVGYATPYGEVRVYIRRKKSWIWKSIR